MKGNVSHLKISLHLSKSFSLSSESSAYQTEQKEEQRKIKKKNVMFKFSVFFPQQQGCCFFLLPFVLIQQIFVID